MELNDFDAFLDTNMALRYLTNEPSSMAAEARRIIFESRSLQVTAVALAETAYVLRTQNRVSREEIVDQLIELVSRDNISVYGIDKDLVLQGLRMCRPSGRVSIADAMIWAAARSAGARTIYTFDRRFPSEGLELRQEL